MVKCFLVVSMDRQWCWVTIRNCAYIVSIAA